MNVKNKSWEHFHASNSRFMRNLFALYRKYEDGLTPKDQLLTQQMLLGYFVAVDTFGAPVYWELI